MVAGYFAAGESQVVRFPATNLELRLGDRDDAAAEGIGDFEAGICHGKVRFYLLRRSPSTITIAAAPASTPATVRQAFGSTAVSAV